MVKSTASGVTSPSLTLNKLLNLPKTKFPWEDVAKDGQPHGSSVSYFYLISCNAGKDLNDSILILMYFYLNEINNSVLQRATDKVEQSDW